VFLALAQKVADYYGRINDSKNQPKIILRLVEHFYYKTEAVYDAMRKLTLAQQSEANEASMAQEEQEEEEDGTGATGGEIVQVRCRGALLPVLGCLYARCCMPLLHLLHLLHLCSSMQCAALVWYQGLSCPTICHIMCHIMCLGLPAQH
jgi:hypothetical protein